MMKIKKKSWAINLLAFIINVIAISESSGQEWLVNDIFNSTENITINHIENTSLGLHVIVGRFKGDLVTSLGTYTSFGNFDIYFAALNAENNLLWFYQLGSSGLDLESNFTIHNDIIYLTGCFADTLKFSSQDTLISTGLFDAYLASFDLNGNLLWKRNIANGPANQIADNIAFDKNDSIILTGFYNGSIKFDGVSYSTQKANFETYFAKFSSDGNFSWAKTLPSTNNISRFSEIKAFNDGYYFSGSFRDSLFLDIGTFVGTAPSVSDIFIYKTDFIGNGEWFRRTYGTNYDYGGSLTQDNFGNLYSTGYFESNTLTVDSTSSLKSNRAHYNKGANDIFIFKYNKNGNLIWVKTYGGKGVDFARSIVQKNNFLYVTGFYSDTVIFDQDTLKAGSLTDKEIYFGTYDLNGNPIQFEHIKGNGIYEDQGFAIAVDNNNLVTFTGDFKSPYIEFGNTQLLNTNTESVFLADYTPAYSAVFTTTQRPSCATATDGHLLVTPYFGVPPYSYTWSHAPDGGINDSVATGLAAGSYTVTVTDSRDSVAIATVNLTAPAPIKIDRTLTDITCFNSANGAIDITVSGGTMPYSYAWSTTDGAGVNATGTDQSGLAAGTYTLSVTDDNGCVTDSIFTLTQPAQINFGGTVVTNASASASDGAIDLAVNGGTPSYTYLWSTGATTEDLTNIPGDNYTVTVTDANGCVRDTSIVVQDVDQVIAFLTSKTDVDCKDNSTGAATGDATGHTGNLSYKWMNASAVTIGTGTGISGLAAGNYTLEITDDGTLQTSTVSFTINEPNELTSTATPIHVQCFGKSTGAANLTVSGGTLPFSYQWDNGALTEDLTKVPEGTYAVTVTDDNGCTTGASATIDQPTAIDVTTNIDQAIFCFGETGTITASATGGTGTKSFLWNDPGAQNTATASLLPARLYTVSATDENGCTSATDVTLTQPDAISLNASLTHVSCNGASTGVIQLTASGGTPTIDFFWSTSDGAGITNPLSRNQSGLSAGTYTVEATDANLCVETASYTINEPPALGLFLAAKTDPLCVNESTGSIEVSATGGSGAYEYSIDGTNWVTTPLFENLAAGTYNIEVRDANATTCVYSGLTAVELTEPAPIVITSYQSTYATSSGAADGTVDVTAAGGTGTLTYTLDGTQQASGSFTGLAVGTYTLSITDDNSCVKDTTISIEEELVAVIQSQTDVDCAGAANGAATGSATGAVGTLSYNWMDDAYASIGTGSSITGLSAGNYHLEVTDAGTSQVDTAAFSILAPDPLSLSLASQTDPVCAGESNGTIEVSATGGSGTYEYSTDGTNWVGTPVIDNLSAGTYTVEVRDASATTCIYSGLTAIDLANPAPIVITAYQSTYVTAAGASDGNVDVTAAGGTGTLTYTLDGNSQATGAFTGLAVGSYTLSITDDNSCVKDTTISIEEELIALVETITDVDCAGAANGAASGNASGAVGTLSFNWMDETFTSVGTGANISGLAAGNYYLEVTDATTQQVDTAAFSITAPEPLVLTLLSQTDPLCAGEATGAIEVSATGGSGNYEYSTDGATWVISPLFENLTAGSYNIEVREAGNTSCTSALSPAVDLVSPAPVTVSTKNTVDASSETASDGAVNIEATGGTGTLTYALDGNQQDNGAFSGLTPGNYTMDITDENGCAITEDFTISFASSVISYLKGNEVKVFPNPSKGTFSLTIENPETRNYEIEILDISGKLVYQKSFNIDFGKEEVTLEISIPAAQKGAYILRINDFAIPNRLVVE